MAGDDEDVTFVERPNVAAVADEPDPSRQVAMIASMIAETMERPAPVWVAYREAAAAGRA